MPEPEEARVPPDWKISEPSKEELIDLIKKLMGFSFYVFEDTVNANVFRNIKYVNCQTLTPRERQILTWCQEQYPTE